MCLTLLLVMACLRAEARKVIIPEVPTSLKPKGVTAFFGGNRRLLYHVGSSTTDQVVKNDQDGRWWCDHEIKNKAYGTISGNPAAYETGVGHHHVFINGKP